MSKVNVKIGDETLTFTSPLARQRFFAAHKGKYAWITIDDQPSANMRRYFEGAIVPAVFYQHPNSGWADFGECREALKFEFLPKRTIQALRVVAEHQVAPSTADLTKAQFSNFVELVTQWMAENGLETPDPEEYKSWRDSAPAANEVYPPLLRLKKKYDIMNV